MMMSMAGVGMDVEGARLGENFIRLMLERLQAELSRNMYSEQGWTH